MPVPSGLEKPRRIAFLTPAVIVFIAVVVAAVFAIAHMAMKGTANDRDALHQAQAERGLPVQDREPYGPADFTEPNEK